MPGGLFLVDGGGYGRFLFVVEIGGFGSDFVGVFSNKFVLYLFVLLVGGIGRFSSLILYLRVI